MQRRDFLKSVPPVVLMPQLRSAPRLKITDIRIVNLKSVRETGKMEAAWNPGTVGTYRIGGGSVIEIHTDQGLSGIGPGDRSGALDAGQGAAHRQGPVQHRAIGRSAALLRWAEPAHGFESGNCVVGPHRQGRRPTALQTLGRGQGPCAGLCQHDPAFHSGGKGAHGGPAQIARLEGDQASGALSDLEGRRPPGRSGAQSSGRRHGDHGGRQPGAVLRHVAAGRDVGFPARASDRSGTGGFELRVAGRAAAALRVR